MGISLYDLSRGVEDAIEAGFEVDPETGEVSYTEAQAGAFGGFEEKLEACAAWAKNQAAFVEALKNEEKAIRARRIAAERRLESFRCYVAECMESAGYGSYRGVTGQISVRHYEHVETTDDLPDEWTRQTFTVAPDKERIREAIQGGAEIPGARIVDSAKVTIK